MLTSSAKLQPTSEQAVLIQALGAAHGTAVREVYVRCVVGSDTWYTPGGSTNVRSELVARGWSKREADSIYSIAAAAQAAAIASAKLSLTSKLEGRTAASNALRKAKKKRGALRVRGRREISACQFDMSVRMRAWIAAMSIEQLFFYKPLGAARASGFNA
jgi:hypothetical protein